MATPPSGAPGEGVAEWVGRDIWLAEISIISVMESESVGAFLTMQLICVAQKKCEKKHLYNQGSKALCV